MRFEIEQRQRPQRARVAHRRRQLQRSLVHRARAPRCRRTCSTAAPRSRRSRCAESGSISRPSTNDSGSSPSIGHSRSSACSKRSSGHAPARADAGSSPRARRCHSHARLPEPRGHVGTTATPPDRRAYAVPSGGGGIRRDRACRRWRAGRWAAAPTTRLRRRARSRSPQRVEESRAAVGVERRSASSPGSTIGRCGRAADGARAAARPCACRQSQRATRSPRSRRPCDAVRAAIVRRVAKEPRQTAQIERDLARAAHLDARRELTRDRHQQVGWTAFRRIQGCKHVTPSMSVTSDGPRARSQRVSMNAPCLSCLRGL